MDKYRYRANLKRFGKIILNFCCTFSGEKLPVTDFFKSSHAARDSPPPHSPPVQPTSEVGDIEEWADLEEDDSAAASSTEEETEDHFKCAANKISKCFYSMSKANQKKYGKRFLNRVKVVCGIGHSHLQDALWQFGIDRGHNNRRGRLNSIGNTSNSAARFKSRGSIKDMTKNVILQTYVYPSAVYGV